jgi:hypothetical protein
VNAHSTDKQGAHDCIARRVAIAARKRQADAITKVLINQIRGFVGAWRKSVLKLFASKSAEDKIFHKYMDEDGPVRLWFFKEYGVPPDYDEGQRPTAEAEGLS